MFVHVGGCVFVFDYVCLCLDVCALHVSVQHVCACVGVDGRFVCGGVYGYVWYMGARVFVYVCLCLHVCDVCGCTCDVGACVVSLCV